MSDCPAYLAVTITDLVLYDQLFSYDLLVLCPATFNVSFRFPTRSTTQGSMTSSFDVQLSDASRSYHVYVTHVDMRRLDDDDDDDQRSEAIVFNRRVSGVTASSSDHSWLFYVVAVVIVVLALLSAFLHADRHLQPGRWIDLTPVNECQASASPSRRPVCAYRLCGNGHAGRASSLDHHTSSSTFFDAKYRCHGRSAGGGRSLQVVPRHRYRLLLCAYATLWLVAGLLATFNVFFFVVSVLVDADWRHVAAMTGDRQTDMARVRRTAETNFTQLIDRHRREELRRYRDSVVERLHACRNHVDNTVRQTSTTLFSTPSARLPPRSSQHRPPDFHHALLNTVHQTSTTLASESAQFTDVGWSIAALTAQRFGSRLSAYGARVDVFTAAFQTKLSAAIGRTMRRYGAYVNSLVNGVWLRFAADVFNSSRQAAPPSSPVSYYGRGDLAMAEFGSFLDVDEVQQIEVWVSRFWQRYDIACALFMAF